MAGSGKSPVGRFGRRMEASRTLRWTGHINRPRHPAGLAQEANMLETRAHQEVTVRRGSTSGHADSHPPTEIKGNAFSALAYEPILWLGERRGMSRRRRELLSSARGSVLEIGAG